MSTTATLEGRYTEFTERVRAAAERFGRSAEELLVVAVSKYAEVDDIRRLIELGHQDFGESRVLQMAQRGAMIQEMMGRRRLLPDVASGRSEMSLFSQGGGSGGAVDGFEPASNADQPIRWHMIGHLQRNKARKCIEMARLIHTVDSLRLVEELQGIAYKQDRVVECLVQVNCTGEGQKSGCAVAAARHLCEQINSMVHLRVRGLMTMGPTDGDEAGTRLAFGRCREIFDDVRKLGLSDGRFNILSMGMSHDFEHAIEFGANVLRIGSAIFGERAEGDGDEDGDVSGE